MSFRNIIVEGNETLRKKCRKIEKFDKKLWTLLDDLADTMYEADGVGLASPQVGILRRVFVIDVGEGLVEFINPEILSFEGSQRGIEGCLSVENTNGYVTRPNKVKVKAQDRNGEFFEMELTELGARAIFHENDHLDGILFVDKVEKRMNKEELNAEYQRIESSEDN